MEINNVGVLATYLSMLYRSKSPVQEIDTPGFSFARVDFFFIKSKILKPLEIPDKGIHYKTHPQWQLAQDMESFLKNGAEHETVYFKTMFNYFMLNLTVFCSISVYCFINGQPVEYVFFELNEGNSRSPITMKSNTISKHNSVPFRVKLNTMQRFAFDLDNGIKSQTARGDFLQINMAKCKVKKPTTAHHCMVILKKGKQIRVFYNNPKTKDVHEICYLVFK